jgi:NADH-quinone oxidoreductase subunit F
MICNADESEPGTFKDRELILVDPHMVLEGIAIASYAIGANTSYVYIRGEFVREAEILARAIAEARKKKFLGQDILGRGYDLEVHIHRGAGAYICGEETALIESIEGKRGLPRLKPPFPAVVGVFGCPTVVNNVETLSCVPHIIEHGGAWFAGIGTERSTGPKLFCVSGHVERPGVYEAPMGVTFREIIEDLCGGVRGGKKLKAFIPGGSSAPVLPADKIDTPADFESVAQAGSMLGSGGLIVMDETVDMVWALENLLTFYAHESCGQCSPCREGSDWAVDILRRIRRGQGRSGDIETLHRIARFASQGMTICPLGDAFCGPISSFLDHFGHEFEEAIAKAPSMPPKTLPILPVRSDRELFGM